jgi:hypothetical protein
VAGTTSHHEVGTDHHEIEGPTDRSFGLVFASVFALVAAYFAWRGNAWWPASLVLSIAFLTLALARPSLLAPLNWLWTRLGLLIGAVVAPIVMAIIYFGLITPMGLLARILGKDFLRLRTNPAAKSYWLARQDQEATPERLRDQF